MTTFLSEARRAKLTNVLQRHNADADVVNHFVYFDECDADKHMLAHAQICADAAEGKSPQVFLALSAACMVVLAEEAAERGWTESQMPLSHKFTTEYVAKHNQKKHN